MGPLTRLPSPQTLISSPSLLPHSYLTFPAYFPTCICPTFPDQCHGTYQPLSPAICLFVTVAMWFSNRNYPFLSAPAWKPQRGNKWFERHQSVCILIFALFASHSQNRDRRLINKQRCMCPQILSQMLQNTDWLTEVCEITYKPMRKARTRAHIMDVTQVKQPKHFRHGYHCSSDWQKCVQGI